ncbi:MAG: recombinase family protein [bacterium]|nr:recombinase family protein [bacterium]
MTTPNSLPETVTRRKALVYVRQSSPGQVANNRESQRLQYGLVERARQLGFREVEVIDDDLALTANGTVERPGFERLVGLLCSGGIGAVLCLQASRLARNGHDWHRVLELCGLIDARVIDVDGVYDPCHANDRLLLGMKGAISEFELNILRRRLHDARWGKARRGELRIAVPIGFHWGRDLGVSLDPDLRVQEVVQLVFTKFEDLGSARQVLLWMRAEGVSFPRPSDGKRTTSFDWRSARYRSIISIIKNPFYAGVYAYGKSGSRSEIVDGRARKRHGHMKPMEDWDIFIHDHHEGYIKWSEYERNQAHLARNAFGKKGGTKSGRGGRGLLSGLLRCGRCGKRLHTQYSGASYLQYRCDRQLMDGGGKLCMVFAGWAADRALTGELLRAVQPLAVEAAVEAERQRDAHLAERSKIHQLELEQARYDAGLAERRYAACDPDNRIVAAQLESRWEEALRRVRACEVKLAERAPQPSAHSADANADLAGLSADLEAAWHAPGVSMKTRQRLTHVLVEEIVADVDEEAGEVVLTIHWKGGQHSEVRARKPRTGEHRRRAPEEAMDVVRTMAGKWPDEQIAATLNRMGFHTGQGNSWSARRVQSLRRTQGIRAYRSADKGGQWLTQVEAAKRLGVSRHQIRRLIHDGILPAAQVVPRAPYQIQVADLECAAIRDALASRRRPCRVDDESQESLFIDVSGGSVQ